MYYAILAAGHGSRLKGEGIPVPKPFVKPGGTSLMERLVGMLAGRSDSAGIGVVINPDSLQWAREHSADAFLDKVDHVESLFTEGSMESLRALAPVIRRSGDTHFCLLTVDSVWRADEFESYLKAFDDQREGIDALMAVTDYVADESPLWVATTPDHSITGFCDTPPEGARYVSGGVYLLPVSALDLLDDCHERGLHRMRDFQRALIANGLRLKAHPFSIIIDVDRLSDLEAASRLLSD
ncbi:MAG: NTP transferase domain-containing protein [Duncaniella sp.]|nr:NTP transferase domain-containing protein [Duncaniella sp.]